MCICGSCCFQVLYCTYMLYTCSIMCMYIDQDSYLFLGRCCTNSTTKIHVHVVHIHMYVGQMSCASREIVLHTHISCTCIIIVYVHVQIGMHLFQSKRVIDVHISPFSLSSLPTRALSFFTHTGSAYIRGCYQPSVCVCWPQDISGHCNKASRGLLCEESARTC